MHCMHGIFDLIQVKKTDLPSADPFVRGSDGSKGTGETNGVTVNSK